MKILIAAIALASASPAFAQDAEPAPPAQSQAARAALDDAAEGVVAVLRGERTADEVFGPPFLAVVSPAQLAAVVAQIEAQFGPLQGLEGISPTGPGSGIIALRFERALAKGPLTLGPDGKVAGLLLNDFQPLNDSPEAIVEELEALPGDVSVLYAPLDGWMEPIVSLDADGELAIGSAFKLYVLSALARQVERGVWSWDDVVALDTRSLPSGVLHDWPPGSPVTLHTLAALMISQSDNTATDQLIHVLGRTAAGEEVIASGHSDPARMLPFLTTLELFGYKGDPARAGIYAMADEERQGVLLEAFAQEIARDPGNIEPPRYAKPTMIDTIEWFASANDIRRLMERIVELDDPTARETMAISPAVPAARRGDWSYVGYKGGSEPGVLNLSWLLQSPAGEWYVLAMSWNDPQAPVDAAKFELLAQRLLNLPRP